jgi:DNA-binding CsgD family transcriptional regulator
MPSAAEVRPLRERVERLGRSGLPERSLRSSILDEVRRFIAFDAYAWLLTDPETSVGASPVARTPDLAGLPRLIRAKYLTEVNRWTGLGHTAVSLVNATGGDLSRSVVWREILHAYGVVDVASAVFRDRFGCWGFLDLWRGAGTHPFTRRELACLDTVVEPITEALRQAQAATFATVDDAPPLTGPVVLLLSPELDVLGETEQTSDHLRALLPTDPHRDPVPAGAYNVAAQLLAREAGVDSNPAAARVHAGSGNWLTLRAARLPGAGPRTNIAVTIERASGAERADLFARSHALSPRERELVAHLDAGRDTREIAQLMFLSQHTVQDYLKAIFMKTGDRNRRSLLARLRGR